MIVVLPTGAGKTVIAAELIKRRPPHRTLYLVPTRILVEQQGEAVRSWTGFEIAKLRGGGKLQEKPFDVLVATPEAFSVAQEKEPQRLRWESFRVVVFDEVHHVLKNHPYRKLALSLQSSSSSQAPRVLGLTALPTYEFTDGRAEIILEQLTAELRITKVATASRDELEANVCKTAGAAAEVLLFPSTAIPSNVSPKEDRTQQQATMFFVRESSGKSTTFARRLMMCVRSMEETIADLPEQPSFVSPLSLHSLTKVGDWGTYAHTLAYSSSLLVAAGRRCGGRGATNRGLRNNYPPRQPQPSSARSHMLAELEHWYEAVRALVVSWEEREDDAATILDMFGCTGSASRRASRQQLQVAWPERVLQNMSEFWAGVPPAFARFEHLKNVLLEKYDHYGGAGSSNSGSGSAFRGIVFVGRRVRTHVLAHVIASDPLLVSRFSASCLYASSSPATASLALSEEEARANLKSFRDGRVNLLLATTVAEEGIDIPAANCVIRYDSMDHAVSLVQGRGRARKANSSFVVFDQRLDRTTADLEAVEQRRLRQLDGWEPNELLVNNGPEVAVGRDPIEAGDANSSDMSSNDPYDSTAEEAEPLFSIGRSSSPSDPIGAGGTGSGASSDGDRSWTTPNCFGLFEHWARNETLSACRSPPPVEPAGAGRSVAPALGNDIERDLTANKLLERGARGVLLDVHEKHGLEARESPSGTSVPPPGVLTAANRFAEITMGVITEAFTQHSPSRLWICTMSYESALREVRVTGEAATGKAAARKLAAAKLVDSLIGSTGMDEGADEPHQVCAAVMEPREDTTGMGVPHYSSNANAFDESSVGSSVDDSSNADGLDRLSSHMNLERRALGILLEMKQQHGLVVGVSSDGMPIPPPGVLSAVVEFAMQTMAELRASYSQDLSTRLWVCNLAYESPLYNMHVSGEAGRGRKAAKKLAAAKLAADLLRVIPA